MANVKNSGKEAVLVRDTVSGDIFVLNPGDNDFNDEIATPGRLVKHTPDYKASPELKAHHWGTGKPDQPEAVVGDDKKDDLSDVI